jgi:hypothetical protein
MKLAPTAQLHRQALVRRGGVVVARAGVRRQGRHALRLAEIQRLDRSQLHNHQGIHPIYGSVGALVIAPAAMLAGYTSQKGTDKLPMLQCHQASRPGSQHGSAVPYAQIMV